MAKGDRAKLEAKAKARLSKSSPGPLVNPVANHPMGAYDGRPKYDPSICDKIPDLYINGEADVEVAVAIGICLSTFYDWVGRYPEFKQAVKKGKAISETWWHKIGRKGVEDIVKVNATIWGMNMRNRFRWDKEDKDKTDREIQEKFDEIKNLAEKILKKNERDY